MKKRTLLIFILLISLFFSGYKYISWVVFEKYQLDDYVLSNDLIDDNEEVKRDVERINEARKTYHKLWVEAEQAYWIMLFVVLLTLLLFVLVYPNVQRFLMK